MRREKEKGAHLYPENSPCRVGARIPGIHRAGASDLERNRSPGALAARISWAGGCSPDQRDSG
jgi:hypothetical protein